MKTAEEIAREIIGGEHTSLSIHLRGMISEAILADRKERDRRVIGVLKKAHSALDVLMGDSDIDSDDSSEMKACLEISALLAELRKEKE